MWCACIFLSSRVQFDDIIWLRLVFWQRWTIVRNFRGNPLSFPGRMHLVLLAKSGALENFQRRTGDKREGRWGGQGVEKLGWKASDTLVVVPPMRLVMKDHEWYLESPCRAKRKKTSPQNHKRLSSFTSEELSSTFQWSCINFLVFLCVYMWWRGQSCGAEGLASGCRGALEPWTSESFSGLGSRSADEASLNIANRSWKICTCAGSASTPATLGLIPSWESSYVYMCVDTHTLTQTCLMHVRCIIGREGKKSLEKESCREN